MTPHHAGCLCGAVRLVIDAEPMAARTCWCRLCQYLGGGTAGVNLCFPADKVTISGEMRIYESVADSGSHMQRGFCPACGTPLTSAAIERPQLIFIRAGALDDPDLMAPEVVIWTSRAPAWAVIDPRIPHHAQQVPPVA